MTLRTNLNVSLTTELCEFVADEVRSGRFRSASEVLRAGLRALQQPKPVVPSPDPPTPVD
ncbi:MAG: type II toxin-antitoxin system ParD family antitoxin, partial [Janthinobacterium lividum]